MEAKDPASGASYYYNKSTGKSQWEKPVETPPIRQHPSPLSIPEGWVEAFDETTGIKYFICIPAHNVFHIYVCIQCTWLHLLILIKILLIKKYVFYICNVNRKEEMNNTNIV